MALGVLAGVPVATVVAGRTDAGVHATGQVVHADTARSGAPQVGVRAAGPYPVAIAAASGDLDVSRLEVRRLNGLLPAAVRVRRVDVAPAGFDARFSALSRRYCYRVCDDGIGDPLRRHDTLLRPRPLDVAAMREASRSLLGEQDFAAYCRHREGATTRRTLLELRWERDADTTLLAHVEADAFCHSLVRSLVGALLAVGEGRRPVSWPAGLLARRRRADEVVVAPAHGLTLVTVRYPRDADLAARAELTRSRRDSATPPCGATAATPER